jgi:hypothetical protein
MSTDRKRSRTRVAFAARRDLAVLAEGQAGRRSDPRERRGWLSFLDRVLTDEIRDAGALSCEELMQMAARPLEGRASRETIEEWWEYAHRRSWLEEHETGRWRLTSTARREAHRTRRRVLGPDPVEGAKAIVTWVLPAVTIGAVALLSGKYLTSWMAILVVCATIALSLLIVALVSRFVDPPMDRWIARRACDWLDGRRVVWWIPRLPEVKGEVRRLYHPDQPTAPETPASPG